MLTHKRIKTMKSKWRQAVNEINESTDPVQQVELAVRLMLQITFWFFWFIIRPISTGAMLGLGYTVSPLSAIYTLSIGCTLGAVLGAALAFDLPHTNKQTLSFANRIFDLASAFLPPEHTDEIFGNALEMIELRLSKNESKWTIHIRIASAIFWAFYNTATDKFRRDD